MLYDIVDWVFAIILFWFIGSDMIEAVTLDVYFYNELQGKRESVIFDQRINLATLTHFFLIIMEDL